MPLIVISLFLVGISGLMYGSAKSTRTVAVVFGAMGLIVLGMATLYALSAVPVWNDIAPEFSRRFKLSVVKTAVTSIAYGGMFFVLAAMFWRRVKTKHRSVESSAPQTSTLAEDLLRLDGSS
jgi:hypothetical protein